MTTTTQPTVATPTRSRATRAFGLCGSACVLLTANAAFAAPTTTNERDLPSATLTPLTLPPLTLTQGDLLRTTSTPTVLVTHREPLD